MIKIGHHSLFLGDCIEQMKSLPDSSVDMVLTDLPYGVTNKDSEAGLWDSVISFDILWPELYRVCKENAAIVLFAQGMFTAKIMASNASIWRYNLIWSKRRASGFLNANRMPLRSHEDICVFYRKLPTYNPQMVECSSSEKTHSRGNVRGNDFTNRCYGDYNSVGANESCLKFPKSVLSFDKVPPSKTVHPTQKPTDLLAWLIRSYSNENDVVLDCTMGSGSTGVACVETGRKFVGVEQQEKYYNIAVARIEKAYNTPMQMRMEI